jgi:addiction module RelE/StbE family toxin
MNVAWLEDALSGMKLIYDYIAVDNPTAAYETIRNIRIIADRLSDYPLMGRPGRVSGTRELVIQGTAYIVPYRLKKDRVEILNVFHGAQDWPKEF